MAVTITYDKKISNESISSYTRKWVADFGDMVPVSSGSSDKDYFFNMDLTALRTPVIYMLMEKSILSRITLQ
ncbi:hypothetical protein ACKFBO_19315 [Yersinia enterocolitica]